MPQRRIIAQDQTLQTIMDSSARAISSIETAPLLLLGEPSATVRGNGYIAKFNQLVRVDPTTGGFAVGLPRVGPTDIGKCVTVVNVTSSANAVSVYPFNGTINGSSTYSLAYGYFRRTFVVVGENQWIDDSKGNLDQSGPVPLWSWNGTDTSQFGAGVTDTGVTSSALSVQTHGGVSGLRVRCVLTSTHTPPGGGTVSIYPILYTPPADYIVCADVAMGTNAVGGLIFPAIFGRWDTTNHKGYTVAQRNGSGAIEINLRRIDSTTTEGFSRTITSPTPNLVAGDGFQAMLHMRSALIRARPSAITTFVYNDNSSPITSAGVAGIGMFQKTAVLGTPTMDMLFRNIRIYDANDARNYVISG